MNERCDSCRFWHPVLSHGYCQRHCPRVFLLPPQDSDAIETTTEWPRTESDDWCGEWRADKTTTAPTAIEKYVAGKLNEATAYAPGNLEYLAGIIIDDWPSGEGSNGQ